MDYEDDSEARIWMGVNATGTEIFEQLQKIGLKTDQQSILLSMAKAFLVDAHGALHDRGRVLLWVGASLGNSEACSLLAVQLREYAGAHADELPAPMIDYLISKAREWERTAAEKVQLSLGGKRALFGKARKAAPGDEEKPVARTEVHDVDVYDGYHYDDRDEPEEADEVVEKVRVPKGAVIVQALGDPDSVSGRQLSSLYGKGIGIELPRSGRFPESGEVMAMIMAEFPWAKSVGLMLERRISIARGLGSDQQQFRPILMLGPAGSGKTSLAVRLAELFGRKLSVTAGGASTGAAQFGGTGRKWAGISPCLPFLAAIESGTCDPAILIDEIDKSPREGAENGSIMAILLGMLNFSVPFTDVCLQAPVDMSNMMFMATANDLSRISAPLMDRFDVVVVERPSPEHFPVVLKAMQKIVARRNGVAPEFMPELAGDELGALHSFFVDAKCSLRTFGSAYEVALSSAVERERAMPN